MQAGVGQKTVVVLGASRSGTSVTAGMLSILGVDMGSVGSYRKTNPKGAFEDKDFQKLNREIFQLGGSEGTYWDPPNLRQIMEHQSQLAPRIQRLVSEKSGGNLIWGWKDGRTALTMELFLPYLTNPHFVIVSRNPLGTAKSSVAYLTTYRKRKLEFLQALKLAHFYTGEILAFLERHPNLPNIFVSFEDVVAEPKKEAERLAAFLGLNLSDETIENIYELVIPRERIEAARKKAAGGFMRNLSELIRQWLGRAQRSRTRTGA